MVYGGEACGYVIRLPGGLTDYHAGDTSVFGDMKIIGELYAPEVAMIPIGDHYTMGRAKPPSPFACSTSNTSSRCTTPRSPRSRAAPDALQDLTRDVPSLEYHILKPGETIGEEKAANVGRFL